MTIESGFINALAIKKFNFNQKQAIVENSRIRRTVKFYTGLVRVFVYFFKLIQKSLTLLVVLNILLSLTACATTPTGNCPDNSKVNQFFSFDMRENRDIKLLDYFYGIPECPAIHNSELMRSRGESPQIESQMGLFRRAHKLYVKWHVNSTGKEYEKTIDLRGLLPKDMTSHEVHFSIDSNQLYVYLITPERRLTSMPASGPKATQYLKTLTIYPEQSK
jgi:hypothetical protein